jgi:hypothetical protein
MFCYAYSIGSESFSRGGTHIINTTPQTLTKQIQQCLNKNYNPTIDCVRGFMLKLLIVLFVILVLQIQSFACGVGEFKSNLIKAIEKSTHNDCQIVAENIENKSIQVLCNAQKTYSISYDTKSIYFLTNTIKKYPYMSQCWVEGQITNMCSVALSVEKCQTWNMKD